MIDEDRELLVNYDEYYKAMYSYFISKQNIDKIEEKEKIKVIKTSDKKIGFVVNRSAMLEEIDKLKKQYKNMYKESFTLEKIGYSNKKQLSKFTDVELLNFRNTFRNIVEAKKDEIIESLWG
ncbi:hypothetical protein [Clostridium massiliamazoniense]|uniref:hypothetical protein n=1 Tax=Clostridium massiliamazoniense TaxID=1347366 RepID=UPI0006D7A261|nr:hypothetical protein [Clostridium massiliamazoniense]